MLLPFVGMILAVFFATKFIHKNSIKELTTSREKIDWNKVFFSFALWDISLNDKTKNIVYQLIKEIKSNYRIFQVISL